MNKCLEINISLRILGRKLEGGREKENKGRLRGKKGKEKEFSISLEPLLLCCFFMNINFRTHFPKLLFIST